MTMDQSPGEINSEAEESQTAFLDKIDLLLNRQTELCIAARLILDQAEGELDGEYCEEAVKCLHS